MRQLKLMWQSLQDFQEGKIPLFTLQANFEFLLSALEFNDNIWKQSVSDHLFNFELISADSAEEGRPFNEILKENQVTIDLSVHQLKNLVQEKLSSIETLDRKENGDCSIY